MTPQPGRFAWEFMRLQRLVCIVCLSSLLFSCRNLTSTSDLLDATEIYGPLHVDTLTATIAVNSQKTFTVSGGKKPYSAKILGSGTVTVDGQKIVYTAGPLIDNVSLNITDALNRLVTVSIDVQNAGTQPSDLSGLSLWLKADALNYSNGNAVAVWTDSSGNGRNFTATGSPTYLTGFVNGLSVVSFTGSNQYFQYPASLELNTSQFTLFVLHYPEEIATLRSPFTSRGVFSGNVRGYAVYTESSSVNSLIGTNGGGWNNHFSISNISTNTWYVSEIKIDSQIFSFSQNGQLQAQISLLATPFRANTTDPSPTVNPLAPARVGAGQTESAAGAFYQGKIAEIIFFNRTLSSGEEQGVRCYLKKKYALSYGC